MKTAIGINQTGLQIKRNMTTLEYAVIHITGFTPQEKITPAEGILKPQKWHVIGNNFLRGENGEGMMEDKFLTTKEVAGIIGESPSWVTHNAEAAGLKPIRIPYYDKQGKRRSQMKFSQNFFREWMNKQKAQHGIT